MCSHHLLLQKQCNIKTILSIINRNWKECGTEAMRGSMEEKRQCRMNFPGWPTSNRLKPEATTLNGILLCVVGLSSAAGTSFQSAAVQLGIYGLWKTCIFIGSIFIFFFPL